MNKFAISSIPIEGCWGSESIISQTTSMDIYKYKMPCRFHFLQNMNKNKNLTKKKQKMEQGEGTH